MPIGDTRWGTLGLLYVAHQYTPNGDTRWGSIGTRRQVFIIHAVGMGEEHSIVQVTREKERDGARKGE